MAAPPPPRLLIRDRGMNPMVGGDCVLRLSWDGFASLCRHLAERVAADFQPEVVVGLARGGTLPGALIALLLRRDFHSLRVPLPGAGEAPPAALPDRAATAGRRVLVVDEQVADEEVFRRAKEALCGLGAGEVRTLTLFARRAGTGVDYTGPEVGVIVLQPWIADAVAPHPAGAVHAAPSLSAGSSGLHEHVGGVEQTSSAPPSAESRR